jgi:hypothetical protein
LSNFLLEKHVLWLFNGKGKDRGLSGRSSVGYGFHLLLLFKRDSGILFWGRHVFGVYLLSSYLLKMQLKILVLLFGLWEIVHSL